MRYLEILYLYAYRSYLQGYLWILKHQKSLCHISIFGMSVLAYGAIVKDKSVLAILFTLFLSWIAHYAARYVPGS